MPIHIVVPVAYVILSIIPIVILYRAFSRSVPSAKATATVVSVSADGQEVRVRYQPTGSVQLYEEFLSPAPTSTPRTGDTLPVRYDAANPTLVIPQSRYRLRMLPIGILIAAVPVVAVAVYFLLQIGDSGTIG